MLAAVVALLTPTSADAAADCRFVLGFSDLRDAIAGAAGSAKVGDCVEDLRYDARGDAYQRTTSGLMVWQKASNWLGFTDGYRTWVLGPLGLQVRLNVERLAWEPATPSTRQPADELIIARALDLRTLDPHRQFETTSPLIVHAAYETLVTFSGTDFTRVVPLLAARWETSADGLVYTFTLRPDVTFHSGNRMTAADVRFSLERLRNLEDNPAWLMNAVERVEIVDDLTARIVLQEPTAAFLAMLASSVFAIVDARTVQAQGGSAEPGAATADRAMAWLDQHSAGTGPFVLRGWTRGEQVWLERHAGYWRGPAKLRSIVVRDVQDPAAQADLLARGAVDAAYNLSLAQVDAHVATAGALAVGTTMDMVYLALTTNGELSPPLADKRVRQAIGYALDYEGIVAGLARGAAVRLPSMVPIGVLGSDPALGPAHDPAQARALLRESGYAGGLTVKLVYAAQVALGGVPLDRLAAKVQADLAAVGIRVAPTPVDINTHLADYRAGKLAMTVAQWVPDFLDPHGWAVPFTAKDGFAARRVAYDNPHAAELARRAGATVDPAERVRLYGQVQQALVDDAAFIGLLQPKAFVALAPDVHGYAFNPVWGVSFYEVTRE